ncbi:MAG: acyl-[ACP]--phospholipid O-acyltransferase [gamma proteobacterium symbiont of Bathyaustriella thionipta]|nr:acyl-[ACP]--phospholipid O-acyltransferase [gamma proteobacterium symbiont of Bathyaustriella thionipta]
MKILMRLRGFVPLLLVVFLNAFVDLGHKILIQNSVFKLYDGETQIILTAIINALILLPFALLFSPAGFISDRFRKPDVMRYSALLAVAITLLITLSYYAGWFWFSFGMTFLLAVQSAIYSPAKFGYVKELVGKSQLAQANGAVQAVAISAILLGIFAFSLLFEHFLQDVSYNNEHELLQAIAPTGWLLVACSVLEWLLIRRLPQKTSAQTHMHFDRQAYTNGQYLKQNIARLLENRTIWLSIVGLSIFWGVSQVMLAGFPAFAKEVLGEDNTVVIQGILAVSGLGIIIGSLLAGKASRGHIETALVPLGALGIVLGLFLMPQLSSSWSLAANFLLLGIGSGLFIVPLNSLIQFHARDSELGAVLAGTNWIENLVMLAFLLVTVLFAFWGMGSVGLFHALTVIALLGAIYTIYRLPQSLVRYLLGGLFASQYRIEVLGLNHLPGQGGVLMLGNHISWLDWAVLQIACPRPIRFVMLKSIYQRWYLKRFLDFFGVIPIAPGDSAGSLKRINAMLKAGEVVCLFPEGAISRNGQLGEFKHGYEHAVEGVEGIILPFYLRGLWGSRFSRSGEHLQQLRRSGVRKQVLVAFGEPLPMDTPAVTLKQRVFDLSIDTWERHTDSLDPLPLAWIKTVKRSGKRVCLMEAVGDDILSGYRTLTAAIAFSRPIRRQDTQANVGLLLPTSSAGIIANMAALLAGKTLVNLNYTSTIPALQSALLKADIATVYSSRRFVKKLKQKGIELDELLSQVTVIYLEDMQQQLGRISTFMMLAAVYVLPASWLYRLFAKPAKIDDAAAILFSSGSEGEPKGVLLSHRNLMSNIYQVSDVLDTQADDVIMASLPLFHAFGLSVTGFMPLVEGIPAVCHPDPTDVLNIAKGIARHQVSILCATSTFLRLFNRNRRIHPLMLQSLRIVVAGAERLDTEVSNNFRQRFGKEIFEGYGATETAPVASVNIPDRMDTRDWKVQPGNRPGTVGMPLPGSSFRIVDPQTLQTLPTEEDGLILIGGSQVMLGYLNDAQKTASVMLELDGKRWYKTGDKGHLDKDGFLTIVDRYSRFAKIGGEMISLGAVETAIAPLLDEESEIMAVALPDEKKGEKLILLFTGKLTEPELKALIKNSELPPIMRPAQFIKVDAIPRLGSGKSDFSAAKKMAESCLADE